MTEYTIDDIRGPTVAREMAQLKEFVLAQFNGAIADAEAAAAAAATAAANAVLANTVKKTGEASQSIAGDVAVTGSLNAASIGSGSTPVVCGNLTAFGSVSLDNTTLQGNLTSADSSALINLSGAGSVLVPTPTSNGEAATKKYVDDALDNYAPMVRTTGNQTVNGVKTLQVLDVSSGGSLFEAARLKNVWFPSATTAPDGNYNTIISFNAANNDPLLRLRFRQTSAGIKQFLIDIAGTDGVLQSLMLLAVDADNNLVVPWN